MTKKWDICEEFDCECTRQIHFHFVGGTIINKPGGGWGAAPTVTFNLPEGDRLINASGQQIDANSGDQETGIAGISEDAPHTGWAVTSVTFTADISSNPDWVQLEGTVMVYNANGTSAE